MSRIEKISKIRKSLASGEITIGSWMQIPDSSIAEIMGQSNYDWIAVDMEHGAISHHQLPDIFRALELGGALPLVRLANHTEIACKQALDAGAGGVIVPMIDNGMQLIKVRDSCRWPPAGIRGVGFSRANLFGQHFDTYHEEAQCPLLVAMIENIRALEDLDSILCVKGLDAILIGPYDLSASLELTAQFAHKKFIDTIAIIREKAKTYNIPLGFHVVKPSILELNQRIDEGYKFLAYSIDSVMLGHIAANPVLVKK